MTEEEAKTKLCPFMSMEVAMYTVGVMNYSAVTNDKHVTDAIDDLISSHRNKCIASVCMMWVDDGELLNNSGKLESSGHCGLARK